VSHVGGSQWKDDRNDLIFADCFVDGGHFDKTKAKNSPLHVSLGVFQRQLDYFAESHAQRKWFQRLLKSEEVEVASHMQSDHVSTRLSSLSPHFMLTFLGTADT